MDESPIVLHSPEVTSSSAFPVERYRQDHPMLLHRLDGKPFIYLDSAASGQKPNAMLDRLMQFYTQEYGKPNEKYTASQIATADEEDTRQKVADFIKAKSKKEIVFVRGATEGINVVAAGFAKSILKKGDEIVISLMEHHANIVPWQMACQQTGARLTVTPITPSGELDLEAFAASLSNKTKIVSLVHSSHVLGTINPIKEIVKMAHSRGIPVMVDGAQLAPHSPVDMQDLDCDFYVFSAHKMGGPTGLGVLYGKEAWLEKIPPLQGGGDMASKVTFGKFTYASLPKKFEAGTTAFADIIAFGALIDYVNTIGMEKIESYEQELLAYAIERLTPIQEVRILGSAPEKEPLVTLTIDGFDVKKVEQFLNERGISVKAGPLSAQPLMEFLGVPAALRASFAWYNTRTEIDAFVEGLQTYINQNR